ncbi:MAG: Ribonuclease [Verrucomicrobiota bacterium]
MIDTDEKLSAYLPTIRAAEWLALDTEADSLHAYPEKVCLIQITTVAGDELIDPLAPIALDPLFAALAGHQLLMHGADYDLRLFTKHHEFVPGAIFDTMLAARLLGEKQFGLSNLVEKFLGVTLDKGSQKADWARRPLTERMEEYARNDTHYIKPLVDKLKSELETKGRLSWHTETCNRLIAESSVPPVVDADQVWRVKGSYGLSRAALAVLRELFHWREREAIAANRPPFFVVNHETLVKISEAAASNAPVDPLVPPRMSPRRRDGLAAAVQAGLKVPPENFPEIPRHDRRRPSEEEFRRFRELEKVRDKHATELAIDPTLIAPRATLGDLASDWDAHAPGLMDWQRELLK